jgi:regulator of protease activity HflC (stomatin/prohibitin superfamily)
MIWVIVFAVIIIGVVLVQGVRIVPEYERGVIFRLGRVIGARGPGLFFIIPGVDQMRKVNMQVVTRDVPPQDIITRDNVTVRVNAVTYYRVVDPVRAIVDVQDYREATYQISQTTLRSIIGQADLDELLVNRNDVNSRLQTIIDEETSPWGVKVTNVEIKDVELDESMRRAMASQAEAERDRRAKVINAQGEKEAALTLAEAARDLEGHPAAMQLRLLSTVSDVASEQNSTLVLPIPVELLSFLSGGRGRQLPPDTEQ